MSTKKTPFVGLEDGRLFVELAAVMHPLIAVSDGLSVTFMGRNKTPYISIDDAIDWCKKEMNSHNKEHYENIIEVMNRAVKENDMYMQATH